MLGRTLECGSPRLSSPTQRTIKELKKLGYTPAIVERWNAFARIRQDLYGIIDIVAIKEGIPGVLGIQCTSWGNGSSRKRKSLENQNLSAWCGSGNVFEIWEWGKKGPRGKAKRWIVKITQMRKYPGWEPREKENHEKS